MSTFQIRRKSILLVFLALATTAIIVAGCGGNTVQESTSASQTPVDAESQSLENEPGTATATIVEPTPELSDESKREKGEINSQALANNLIGDPATREFGVFLPPGYATSDKRYPVVYVLHGYSENLWSLAGMLDELEAMLDSGEVEDMIIVFVDGTNRFGGSWYLSSPTIGDYESYISQELVDHVDANYRTLPERESRGITGCSMGGDGALHLALNYPDVFSVSVPISAIYDNERDPSWDDVKEKYWQTPEDLDEFDRLDFLAQRLIASAAAAASNPDNPPFYLNMPLEEIDPEGEALIVQDVWDRVSAVSSMNDVGPYLDQEDRLSGLMLYHGENDNYYPVESAREFDKMLTELGVEHEYVEVDKGHCNLDYAPVLSFMSDHLASE